MRGEILDDQGIQQEESGVHDVWKACECGGEGVAGQGFQGIVGGVALEALQEFSRSKGKGIILRK